MNLLKGFLALGIFVACISILVIYLRDQKEQNTTLLGTYQIKDAPGTKLNLLPGSNFTLDKKLNETYYGDGNWNIENNQCILYFENGEILELHISSADGPLVNEEHHIQLQKGPSRIQAD